MGRAKRYLKDLGREIGEDDVTTTAAALAFNMMLAIFPAAIFLLSLLPYLPIANLEQAVMDALHQAMPGEAASLFEDTVRNVVSQRRGGLLSVGALLTLWAMSGGMASVMTGLNTTYDVHDERPFWKQRGIAILLSLAFVVLLVVAFALIVGGGALQSYAAGVLGWSGPLRFVFAAVRWIVILGAILLAFALVYYFGPNVEQKFSFVTPGSLVGTLLLALAAFGFRLYVENFASYNATYGSLGAVIILLMWLYITGLVVLVGSEINALTEHYAPVGKSKGHKRQPENEPRRADGEQRPGPERRPPWRPEETYQGRPEDRH